MGTYAVTGAASGMGKATADTLRAAGHAVIGVDLRDVEVVADLSTPEGRADAAARVLDLSAGRLDGAVLAAGLGPLPGRERTIAQVNYFGVVTLLEAWRPALAASGSARVVVFSSNSTTIVPGVPRRTVKAFLTGDADRAIRATRIFGKNAAAMVYAGSKIAVTHWMRRAAVLPEWVGAGIRMNAIAPGAVLTPLVQAQLDDPDQRAVVEGFPVPVRHLGDARQVAEWVVFMLSPAAEFMVGSVVFVDGGSDAYYRADDFPRPLPLTAVGRYLRRTRQFAA